MKQIRGKPPGARHRRSGISPEQSARRKKTLLGILILAVGLALFLLLAVTLCRSVSNLLSDPDRLRAAVQHRRAVGVLMFFGLEVLQGFLPIPLELTTVAAGYVFGPFAGLLLTICAMLCSTSLVYYCSKVFGRRFFHLLFPRGEHPWILRDAKVRDWTTWLIFLIPGLPKRLFIFSAALVPQKFSKFLVISTVARIPSLLVCSFGGHALGSGEYRKAILLLCAVIVPAVAAFLIYHSATDKKRREKTGKQDK